MVNHPPLPVFAWFLSWFLSYALVLVVEWHKRPTFFPLGLSVDVFLHFTYGPLLPLFVRGAPPYHPRPGGFVVPGEVGIKRRVILGVRPSFCQVFCLSFPPRRGMLPPRVVFLGTNPFGFFLGVFFAKQVFWLLLVFSLAPVLECFFSVS